MKKLLFIVSLLCFSSLFGYILFAAVKPFVQRNLVTEIKVLKNDEIVDSTQDKKLMQALMYRETNGQVNTNEPGFISQFMYSNFGTYLTGVTSSIPKEKQHIKDDVLISMLPFLIDFTVDPDKTSYGDEYKIEDFYKQDSSIIIKLKKITS